MPVFEFPVTQNTIPFYEGKLYIKAKDLTEAQTKITNLTQEEMKEMIEGYEFSEQD